MKITDCFKAGFVQRPHGLRGEVTVVLAPDAPIEAEELKTVFLEDDGRLIPYFVDAISLNGSKALVKFQDVDTLEAAEKISKKSVYLPKTERPKSGRGEFYDDEVIGFDVEDEVAGPLGQIQEIIQAGANKLIVVLEGEKEVLIPVNSPFVVRLNKTTRKMTVSLPEGYLDI